jgi:hypothetical protein
MIDFLTEIRKNERNHGNLPSRDPNWRYEILIYFFIKGNQIRLWNQFLPPLSTLSYRTTKEKEKNRIEIEKTTNRWNIYLANSQQTNLRKKQSLSNPNRTGIFEEAWRCRPRPNFWNKWSPILMPSLRWNKIERPGVNLTNVLCAAFMYVSCARSFFVLTFQVCTSLAQDCWLKSCE